MIASYSLFVDTLRSAAAFSLLLCSWLALSASFAPDVLLEADHNAAWFTQGLYLEGETLYISSGHYGRSKIIMASPSKRLSYSLPRQYFAEGLTVVGDTLYLLSWKENTLLAFDKKTFEQKDPMRYEGEGWGLTHTDSHFIMSNGSNQLLFRRFDTFNIETTLTIENLDRLNELEYVNGTVWANRWHDDHIYAINVKLACVTASIDLSSLRKKGSKPVKENVVNGIAYDPVRNGLWVTGKYWSKRYLIRLPDTTKEACL